MKIDFTQTLKDIKGKPIQTSEKDTTPISLGTLCQNALLAQYDSERNLDGTEKMKRWKLARKIDRGVVDLQAEDISKIKEVVGKGFGPSVLGPVYELLDPEVFEAEPVKN